MRTVAWDYESNRLLLIDQRVLPGEFNLIALDDYQETANAIRDMVVRGAPAIGATAAFGLVLAAQQSSARSVAKLREELRQAAEVLRAARPTATNLGWALERIFGRIESCGDTAEELRDVILQEAQFIADQDVEINQQIARHGETLIDDGDTIIHHCNTGALAAVDWGTALGVIRMAHEMGKRVHVLVDETRPRLQGARLTAWELQQYGISFDIISDNAAGHFLRTGQVQKVLFGADRVAANGDVANKIGTYMLALAAWDNNVPAYAVVPSPTIDHSIHHGSLIPIEERSQGEVLDLQVGRVSVTPAGATARNPAFDVTPNRLIRAIVTEQGIIYPPYDVNLARLSRL